MSKNILKTAPLGFQWPTLDPFLFCVHHLDQYPAGNGELQPSVPLRGRKLGNDFEPKEGWRMYHGQKVPGFPQHPHRGFETVTVVRNGYIDHSDSLGAIARFGQGDTQWLTAGKGIVHCEMFPLLHADKPNPLELFQIWLNLPKSEKMCEPHFSMLWGEQIPKPIFTDNAGKKTQITVVAGALGETHPLPPPPHSWAADASHHVAIWALSLEALASFTLPAAPADCHRMVYFFAGSQLLLDGTQVEAGNAFQVRPDLALNLVNGETPAEIFVLQGKPIAEPTFQYGPFVMNSRQEIEQAFADYQQTRFGGWPWPSDEPTHGLQEQRFAKRGGEAIEKPAS